MENQNQGQELENQQEENNRRYQQREENRKKRALSASDLKNSWRTGKILWRVVNVGNPVPKIIAGIIFFIIIFKFFFSGGSGFLGYEQTPESPGETPTEVIVPGITLTIVSFGEDNGRQNEVENGENIVYEITVTYDISQTGAPISSFVATDILPLSTTFVRASPECTRSDPPTGPDFVECGFQDPPPGTFTGTEVFEIVVKPTEIDTYIYNTVRIRRIGSPIMGAATEQATCSPTNGAGCLTKENLYELLKKEDPKNANYWFYKIIPCESGFDQNATTSFSDKFNSVGLFQFLEPLENPPPRPTWQEQVKMAIKYNNETLKEKFSYWACSN